MTHYKPRKVYQTPHGPAHRYAHTFWTLDGAAFWFPQLKGGKPGKHEGGWYLSREHGGQPLNDWLHPCLGDMEAAIVNGGDGSGPRLPLAQLFPLYGKAA